MLRLSMLRNGLVVAVVLALFCVAPARAAVVNLITEGSSGTLNGATFQQFDPAKSTGTGVIDSFLRVQKNNFEKGYNTDSGTLEFDEKGGGFTHSIQLGSIPTVTLGGIVYREFLLDINESSGGGNNILSLDALKIHIEDTGNLSGYPGVFSAAVYDMDAGGDNYVKLDANLSSGSGDGDMLAFIPSSLFGSDQSKYVYLYCEFGDNYDSDGGFEEWAIGVGGPVLPEPGTMVLLASGGVGLLLRRRRS
ncbi:MAG: PEP-CTERM sorting domain-containing protein [Planctomycetota bacterium]|nr:PEP-CTERM sorting domain-containing protein [Planctomycetota bacterium]